MRGKVLKRNEGGGHFFITIPPHCSMCVIIESVTSLLYQRLPMRCVHQNQRYLTEHNE